MKRLLLTLFLLTALSSSAQLSIEFVTPDDGQRITGKQLDVTVHALSDNPWQIFPVHVVLWDNDVFLYYVDIYDWDEVISIRRTFSKGTHVFEADIYDDEGDWFYANPVTTYRK